MVLTQIFGIQQQINFSAAQYDSQSVIKNKKVNKKALQESLGLEVDDHKIVIGLISRLTNQKGLDLVNDVIPSIMDEHMHKTCCFRYRGCDV